MDYNELREGITISGLSFGCSRLGKSIHDDNSKTGIKILQLARDLGITYFDTSTNYSYGDSEKILGRFKKKIDAPVIISTKGGLQLSGLARYAPYIKPIFKLVQPFANSEQVKRRNKKILNFSPDYLSARLNLSLDRLGISTLPIYYLHIPPQEILQSPNIPHLFSTFKENHWITLAGVSISNLMDIKKCTYLDEIDVIQFPINYMEFEPEYMDVLSMLKEKNIGLVGRSPFARGLLTSKNRIGTGPDRGDMDIHISQKKDALCRWLGINDIQLALWFLRDLNLLDSILFSSFNPEHLKEIVTHYESEIPSSFDWKDIVMKH